MYDVVAIGELLVDMLPKGNIERNNHEYIAKVGGAPVNLLSGLSKWGCKTAFIGKVGNDVFGRMLVNKIGEVGIEASGVVFSETDRTAFTLVTLDEKGERSFDFYRNPGADQFLHSNEVKKDLIKRSRVLHFGTLSLTHEPSRGTTFEAIKLAKKNNSLISFDPNFRRDLWDCDHTAREMIERGLGLSDMVKFSEDELGFFTGIADEIEAIKYMQKFKSLKLLFVTKGENGCIYSYKNRIGYIESPTVQAIDTTGAGDAFFSAVIYSFLKLNKDLGELTIEEVEEISKFANFVAAKSTLRKGGFDIVPTIESVKEINL